MPKCISAWLGAAWVDVKCISWLNGFVSRKVSETLHEAGSTGDADLASYLYDKFNDFKLDKVWNDEHYVRLQVPGRYVAVRVAEVKPSLLASLGTKALPLKTASQYLKLHYDVGQSCEKSLVGWWWMSLEREKLKFSKMWNSPLLCSSAIKKSGLWQCCHFAHVGGWVTWLAVPSKNVA